MSYIKTDLGNDVHALLHDDGGVFLWFQYGDVPMGVSLSSEQMQELTGIYSVIQHEFTEKAMREERGMTYAPEHFPFNRLNAEVHE